MHVAPFEHTAKVSKAGLNRQLRGSCSRRAYTSQTMNMRGTRPGACRFGYGSYPRQRELDHADEGHARP